MSKSDDDKYQHRFDQAASDCSLQASAIETIGRLQQRILKDEDETRDTREALARAYQELPEELKIAFLLSRGNVLLFQCQQQTWRQSQRGGTDQLSSDSRTGDLPVLC